MNIILNFCQGRSARCHLGLRISPLTWYMEKGIKNVLNPFIKIKHSTFAGRVGK
jgi:hypothetical protein